MKARWKQGVFWMVALIVSPAAVLLFIASVWLLHRAGWLEDMPKIQAPAHSRFGWYRRVSCKAKL